MSNKSNHSIYEIGVTGSILQNLIFLIVPFISKLVKNPNLITFFNFFLSALIIFSLVNNFFIFSGFLIFISLFFDLIDGSLARYLDKTSIKGMIYDSLADLFVWLSLILSLFIVTKNEMLFGILILYCLDLYLRILITKVSVSDEEINQNTLLKKSSLNLKILFNHFDSLSFLAIILILNPSILYVWIYYEFIRRTLNFIKRSLKIYSFL